VHAWESIQKSVDYIEENLGSEIQIEELADIAALSVFYFQRLFTRLVKIPIREYIKLRRLARACKSLENKDNRILDIAIEYGFGSHATFTKAFKEAYRITPTQYRESSVGLSHFDKPNLLLNYVMIDEGVPLISNGLVLEMNRKTLEVPIDFLGVADYIPFESGKMLGERPGVSKPSEIWDRLFKLIHNIPFTPSGRKIGVCYNGGAPAGYTTYFAGVEVEQDGGPSQFASWQLPAREYVVCEFEAENFEALTGSALGKAMKYTRFWLKKHGLIADDFFPEIYYQTSTAYMELWIPFKKRENINV